MQTGTDRQTDRQTETVRQTDRQSGRKGQPPRITENKRKTEKEQMKCIKLSEVASK